MTRLHRLSPDFRIMILIGLALFMPTATCSQPSDSICFCKPYTWLFGEWVAPPRLPLVADINGDNYADLIYASPAERLVDISLSGKGLKPLRGRRLLEDLPQTVLSMCACSNQKTGIIAILGADGMLTQAQSDARGSWKATGAGRIADIRGKGWLVSGSFVSLDETDLAVIAPSGVVRLVALETGKSHGWLRLPEGIISAAAGDVDGDGFAELALQTKTKVTLYRLRETAQKMLSLANPKGQQALAMGDVNADGKADLLANGCILLGPDLKKKTFLDGWEGFRKPVLAFLADMNDDNLADVVVQHEGPDYYGSLESDCDIYLTYHKNDSDWDDDGLDNVDEEKLGTDPTNRDTDNDGLLDGWEVHGFGETDFPAMGASPLHKDVFIMNVPANGTSCKEIERQMKDVVVPFFAKLPYKNLDGTQGFAIHSTVTPPLSTEQTNGKGWEQLADELFPRDSVGSWHWMEISGIFGGGQSALLADVGSTGMDSWIHELGHQLGLTHSGKWSASSPTYFSLMNYAYSSQFNGKPSDIRFSTGELASLVLNERHLQERIPYPYEKLKCLWGKPYEFRVKALSPNETWVDWNWNGILDLRPVGTDINWLEVTNLGPEFNLSGRPIDANTAYQDYTDFTPKLAVYDGNLYCLVVRRPPLDPKAARPGFGRLMISRYKGHHSFEPGSVIDNAVTGDPSAVSDGKALYVFYPTASGVVYRFGKPNGLSAPILVSESIGLQVRAFVWKSTVYALFYPGPERNIVYRSVKESVLGTARDLGIKSTTPPGIAIDTVHHELLLGIARKQGNQAFRWQLCRYVLDDETEAFKQVAWEWLGGEKSGWSGSSRPDLIFNAEHENGPEGRIYFIWSDKAEPSIGKTSTFIAQSTAYRSKHGGWILKRVDNSSCCSRLTPEAAWFNDDIVLAQTYCSDSALTDGSVFLCYQGLGISDIDMADSDDISLMANYGIPRSINTFTNMLPCK